MKGNRPDTATLPLPMKRDWRHRFAFDDAPRCRCPVRVRLHMVDEDSAQAPQSELTVKGHHFERTLPSGLGIQNRDPAHLAFPAAVGFDLPSGTLLEGSSRLDMRPKNDGWFARDSLNSVSAVANSQEHL